MRSTFDKLNCPCEIRINGEIWNATVTILKNKYHINFTSSDSFEPLDIDCEIIEGNGRTLEDAIKGIKAMMKEKKLIR